MSERFILINKVRTFYPVNGNFKSGSSLVYPPDLAMELEDIQQERLVNNNGTKITFNVAGPVEINALNNYFFITTERTFKKIYEP